MLYRRHLRPVAMILVAISIVAFTPRVQGPHLRLACGSTSGTTLSGSQRFTDDSSRLPDLQAGCESNNIPLPQYAELVSGGEAAKPLLSFRSTAPPVRTIVRRYKLLPSRAESQDPL